MSGLELDPVLLQRRLHHLATAVSRLESFKSVTLEQLDDCKEFGQHVERYMARDAD